MIEFDCCECGRHIVAITLDSPREPPLCAECIYLPGWTDDRQLAAIIDPDRTQGTPA